MTEKNKASWPLVLSVTQKNLNNDLADEFRQVCKNHRFTMSEIGGFLINRFLDEYKDGKIKLTNTGIVVD
jgi:hypothetical protein